MDHFGWKTVADMPEPVMQTYAAMLGLTTATPGLGHYDAGWRGPSRRRCACLPTRGLPARLLYYEISGGDRGRRPCGERADTHMGRTGQRADAQHPVRRSAAT